jgi:hypothetical protein
MGIAADSVVQQMQHTAAPDTICDFMVPNHTPVAVDRFLSYITTTLHQPHTVCTPLS